jgi:hypothetical protein
MRTVLRSPCVAGSHQLGGAIIPVQGHRRSSPRLPQAKLIGDDHHKSEQKLKPLANLRRPSAVTVIISGWRQNGSLEFLAKPMESLLERVKGIEPSYSAWKSDLIA